jgi:gliding motility-associated-like protein
METKVYRFFTFFLLFITSVALAQTNNAGKITHPNGTTQPRSVVLDPDNNGYVSKTTNGFSGTAYSVEEFEIKMFGIPKLTGDVTGDNIGQVCGITDLIPDRYGYSVYAAKDAANNLIFRFRVGDDNPSVEAWTILLDTDGKFGFTGPNADPNATGLNPGFEIDITFIKRSNAGVYVYNIDGISSCPTNPVLDYAFYPHFQISYADTITCGDPDFFYDFFVPFAEIAQAFGIDVNTGLRYAAVTNVSATCAMAGKIADISGVDYDDYKDNIPQAFIDLVENQCPTPVADLVEDGPGFEKDKVEAPIIFEPLKAGQMQISGATQEQDKDIYIKVEVYTNIGTEESPNWSSNPANARETKAVYAVGNSWTVFLDGPLQAYDKIVARAQKTEESVPCGGIGGNESSSTSVTVVTLNIKPVITGTSVPLTYIENSGAVPIEPNVTVTDADDEFLEGATVTIIFNYVQGEDVLTFLEQFGITGTFDATMGKLTLTGQATVAQYQAVLRTVRYTNTSEDPSDAPRTVEFIVSDPLDDSDPYTRIINVVPVNDPPVANNQSVSTLEDTEKDIALTGSDVDNTANELAYIIVSLPTNGTLTNSNGDPLTVGSQLPGTAPDVTYTPNSNFNGEDSFTFKINDGTNDSNTATVTITVTPDNDPPVIPSCPAAAIDVQEDSDFTNNPIVLSGTDVDGNTLTFIITAGPSNGDLSGTGANRFYKPNANYFGADSFTYTVSDGEFESDPCIVNINVINVNDAPVISGSANNTTQYVLGGVVVDGNLSVTDIDNTTLVGATVSIINNITNNFEFGDNLEFTDQNGITGIYDANTGILALSGTATLAQYSTAIASIQFINDGGSTSTRRVTFVANDGESVNNLSAAYHVFINFGVNVNPPVGQTPQAFGPIPEDTPTTFCLVVTDDDGDALEITAITEQVNGTFTVAGRDDDGNLLCFLYQPPAEFHGIATAKITVCDVVPGSQCIDIDVIVTVTEVNDPPVADDDVIEMNEDNYPVLPTAIKNILANDSDIDNALDPSSVEITSTTDKGTFVIETTNETECFVRFEPNANYFNTPPGTNLVIGTYTVKDVEGKISNPATITVIVHAINDAPDAFDNPNVITDEETPVSITLTGDDIDNTAAELTYFIQDPPNNGELTFVNGNPMSGTNPSLVYTPFADFFNDEDSFTFYIKDIGDSVSNVATVTIRVNAVNHAPVIACPAIPEPVMEDSDFTNNVIVLVFSDINVDDVLTLSIVSEPQHGEYTYNATTRELRYKPVPNFFGEDSFTFRVYDGELYSEPCTIYFDVEDVNDPPYLKNPLSPVYDSWEDKPFIFCPGTHFADEAHEEAIGKDKPFEYELIDESGNIKEWDELDPDVDGVFPEEYYCRKLVPPLNINGIQAWKIVAIDKRGASSLPAEFSIDIKPVNDEPVATDDYVTAVSGKETIINVLANDLVIAWPYKEFYGFYENHPDHVDLLVTQQIVVQPTKGTVEINQDNTISYRPDPIHGETFEDFFVYSICDTYDPPADLDPLDYSNPFCGITATVYVNVVPPDLKIFEGVSPDGNGANDYWIIQGISQEKYRKNHVQIFDRYNNLVWQTTDYSDDNHWSGQSNHGLSKNQLPEGTYYYIIKFGNGERYSGFVYLKRE